MAYDARSVRSTLVIRAFELLNDPTDGRNTRIGDSLQSAISSGFLVPVLKDGTWRFTKGDSASPAVLAQLFDEIDQIIDTCPRLTLPRPIVGYAATREPNAYRDVVVNAQGAMMPLDPRGEADPVFVALDEIAKEQLERDLDGLTQQYAVTLPLADYRRVQRDLTADTRAYGTLQSELLNEGTIRIWLPSSGTDAIRAALSTHLQRTVPKAARESVRAYLVQGFGRSYFGDASLEAMEVQLQQLGPTQFDELHKSIGRELNAAKQAQYAADHDQRAAELARLISHNDAWSVTTNFLAPAKSDARKLPFPSRPPFDAVLDELLKRSPQALATFQASLQAQLSTQAKDVMNYSEAVYAERTAATKAEARRGSERISSAYSHNVGIARAAGVADDLQRQLIQDALSGNGRDRYADELPRHHPLQLVEHAYGRIGAAPTVLVAQVRRAIADEMRRSIPRDERGVVQQEGRFPRTFIPTRIDGRHVWAATTSTGATVTHEGPITGVVTAFYGANERGNVRDFRTQLSGPRSIKGKTEWRYPTPKALKQPLLAVIQPVIVPRDLDTVGQLYRRGFGRGAALERMTVAISKHLKELSRIAGDVDLRTIGKNERRPGYDDIPELAAIIGTSLEAPANKREFNNRWCDTAASPLAIALLERVQNDNTSQYSKTALARLPVPLRNAFSDLVFSHVDTETMRTLTRVDDQTKVFVDLTSVRSAFLNRDVDATQAKTADQNLSVYGTMHHAKATPVTTFDAIMDALAKSTYLKDTVSTRLNADGTAALSLTDANVLLKRQNEARGRQTVSQQTITQDDHLRTMRDRIQDAIGSAYEITFRYATPLTVSIAQMDLQELERFRRAQLSIAETPGLEKGTERDAAAPDQDGPGDDDHEVEVTAERSTGSGIDLFDPTALQTIRAGIFRPGVTITLHPPEALTPGAAYPGHILHSDRVTTTLVHGADVYTLPTSSLGTTLEVGSFANVVWRDEDHAQISIDPTRFSPDLANLTRNQHTNVKDIVSHERAALRMILAQNEHEHGPLRGMTAAELNGQTQRTSVAVIGASERQGYALGIDNEQRALVLPYEQLGVRPNIGDNFTLDVIPDPHEGYKVRPIERIAQPTADPVNASYVHAMETVARMTIAQQLQIQPDQVRKYEPAATAHSVASRVLFASTDLTYFSIDTPEGPRIASAPTFGRLEATGTFGDPDVGARAEFDPMGKAQRNAFDSRAKELVSMNAIGEMRKGYYDRLGTTAIPPVPEVLQAIEAGAARLYFENGRLTEMEPVAVEHEPIPHAIFSLNSTLSEVALASDTAISARDQGVDHGLSFNATVASTEDRDVVMLAARVDGKIAITPLDRDLISDPDNQLEPYRTITMTFDDDQQRYTVSLGTGHEDQGRTSTQEHSAEMATRSA